MHPIGTANRLKRLPNGLAGRIDVELVEKRLSEECACPEEEWLVNGCTTIIHMESDGKMHVLIDSGDDGATDMMFHSIASLDDGRDLGLGWARAMLYSTSGWS